MRMPLQKTGGFTLVELMIVFVLIGLVAGVVIAGRSLIKVSEVKSIMEEVELFVNATKGFEGKYGYLPGDMPSATNFWGTDSVSCPSGGGTGTCNGNGNTKIGIPTEEPERFRYWQQLALAGLIDGQFSGIQGPAGSIHAVIGTNVPASTYPGGGYTLYYFNPASGDPIRYDMEGGHQFIFGAQHASDATFNKILTQGEAYELDSKFDDGKPAYGKIKTFKSTYALAANCATSDNPALAQYNNAAATENDKMCQLFIDSGF